MNAKWIRYTEWTVAIMLSGLVLFMFFIRATHAGALWRDECDSVQLARLPGFADILHNLKFTSFPILFPTTIRLFTNVFGTSDASLRGFGFLIGVAFLIIVWFNARKTNADLPLILPALLGLNATFLIDGTWIRGYGLGSVLLILSFGLTAIFVAGPNWARLISMFVCYIASMQCLYFTAAIIPAFLLAAFGVCLLRRQFQWAIVVCVVAALCGLSYLPQLETYREIKDWTVLLGYPTSPGLLWREFLVACGEPVPFIGIVWLIVVSLAIVGSALLFARQGWRGERDILLFGLLTIFIGATGYFTFLTISHTAPQTRYHLALLCLLAAVSECIVAGLCRSQWVRIARLVFVLALMSVLPTLLWPKITSRQTTIDLIAKNLQRYAAAEDLIVVNPWFIGPSFSWYYRGQTPWMTLPELSEKRIHRYDLIKAKMEESDAIADLRLAISNTLQSGNRVWLVGGIPPSTKTERLSLSRAPDPQFGWSSQAYTYAWGMQIGAFVQEHVVDGELVLSPMKSVSLNENIPLLVARGWRD